MYIYIYIIGIYNSQTVIRYTHPIQKFSRMMGRENMEYWGNFGRILYTV